MDLPDADLSFFKTQKGISVKVEVTYVDPQHFAVMTLYKIDRRSNRESRFLRSCRTLRKAMIFNNIHHLHYRKNRQGKDENRQG